MSHTRAIYGAIRDRRLQEAITKLQSVLRVSARPPAATDLLRLLLNRRPGLRVSSQLAPGSRAALSLLAYCHYQLEDYEAAADRCALRGSAEWLP